MYSDALGRVAEAETRLFHFYVHERRRVQGTRGHELDVDQTATDRLMPLIEPIVLYFHRRAWRRALAEDAVMHLEEYIGVREGPELPGQLRVTIVFIDLAGFTFLTHAMGDSLDRPPERAHPAEALGPHHRTGKGNP